MLAAIALGLLQLIALKFSPDVWERFHAFLHTFSPPSFWKNIKDVVGYMVLEDFLNIVPSATMQDIRDRFLSGQKTVQDSRSSAEQEAARDGHSGLS